ncbi:MAG TPA: hypothetical protein VFC44_06095 [Candidatus Saccharimonadales bacterium]|nr:hypothetical protein [Candidatus Saccharimonadales bacterium]
MSAAIQPKNRVPLENYPSRLRPDQVAAYLSCTAVHVQMLIRKGALSAVNISAADSTHVHYMVTRQAVREFEARNKC